MTPDRFLESYNGESPDALIALAGTHRIDSIVLAFEQAVMHRLGDRDALSRLTEPELTILAVEAMEREVNNGGYHQFFLNTPEYAPHLVAALERIGCPDTAQITRDAITLIGLKPPFTTGDVEGALQRDAEGSLIGQLSDACDGRYYSMTESIADRLFEYIQGHRGEIRIPAE